MFDQGNHASPPFAGALDYEATRRSLCAFDDPNKTPSGTMTPAPLNIFSWKCLRSFGSRSTSGCL